MLPEYFDDQEVSLVAILHCYLDESGKFGDKKVVALAGALAYEDDWKAVSRDWNYALRDEGLPFLKMSDAMNLNGPFKNWRIREEHREDLRDQLLVSLLKPIRQRMYSFFSCPMGSEYFKSLPQVVRDRIKDPVYLHFESLMRMIAEQETIRRRKHIVYLSYDCSEQYSSLCLKLYHRLRMQNPELREIFRGISFTDEEHSVGLQIADIFAYCQREIFTLGKTNVRPVIQELDLLFVPVGSEAQTGRYQTEWHGELGESKVRRLDNV